MGYEQIKPTKGSRTNSASPGFICQVNVQALPLKFQIIQNMMEAQMAPQNKKRSVVGVAPSPPCITLLSGSNITLPETNSKFAP